MLLLATLLTSCGSTHYASPEASRAQYYQSAPDPITNSLFSSPESTISEADIQRILNGEITLPEKLRMAVLQLNGYQGNRYWYGSETYRTQLAAYFKTIVTAAEASDRTTWVSALPKLLVSQDRNIFTLRESAVRMQADVLLLYNVSSDIYSEFKLFKKDEGKAYANIEAMLLDIRTGVIVWTEQISAEASGSKVESDTGQDDFYRRLRTEAEGKAIEDLGERLKAYLTD
ncbi:hypothetical protein CEQ90_04990 [Lewinellaceae bacterium SD302]|nr:hypothetical protein CEQ90_04990 [Lewinellaceae bacterium SD302]